GPAGGDGGEDFTLTWCELRGGRGAQLADQPSGHRRGQHRLASMSGADRLGELGTRGVLQQVARCAGLHRPDDVGVGVVRGQDEDRGVGISLENQLRGFGAVDARHAQVHEHDVRAQPAGHGHRLVAVAGLADDFDVVFGGEHARQPGADDRMVVHQEQAQCCHGHPDYGFRSAAALGGSGNVARTVVPAPGALTTSSTPPACSTRARMPCRPYPSPATSFGAKPHPSSMTATVTEPGEPGPPLRKRKATWTLEAAECRRTLASASCVVRSKTTSSLAGRDRASPSAWNSAVISVSRPTRSTARPIASTRVASCRLTGARAFTNARASARLSRAVDSTSANRSLAAGGSRSRAPSMACASVRMLVNPCASVSWISCDSRSRSASTPRECSISASSVRVRRSSSMSAARRSAWMNTLVMNRPISNDRPICMPICGATARKVVVLQPSWAKTTSAKPIDKTNVDATAHRVDSRIHRCGIRPNSKRYALWISTPISR